MNPERTSIRFIQGSGFSNNIKGIKTKSITSYLLRTRKDGRGSWKDEMSYGELDTAKTAKVRYMQANIDDNAVIIKVTRETVG